MLSIPTGNFRFWRDKCIGFTIIYNLMILTNKVLTTFNLPPSIILKVKDWKAFTTQKSDVKVIE